MKLRDNSFSRFCLRKSLQNGRKMLLAYVILYLLPCAVGFPNRIPIGTLFDTDDQMIRKAFELSVKAVNKNIFFSPDLINVFLTPVVERVNTNTFQVARIACEVVSTGVAGIFGPQDKAASHYVESMCDTMDIPYIIARLDHEYQYQNVINLYPQEDALSVVFYDLVEELGWKSYAIVYDNRASLIRANRLLKLKNVKDFIINLYHLGTGPNFRVVFKEIKMSGHENMIIDCSDDILSTVLEQAQQVGVLSAKYNVIVTALNFQTLDLEPYQYSGVNLTGVRLIDPENAVVRDILESPALDWNITDPSTLRVEPALLYDAVQLFAAGYARLKNSQRGNLRRLFCNSTKSQTWEHGNSLSNFMLGEEIDGLTGLVKFDTAGFRSDFHLDIVSVKKNKGLKKVGTWNTMHGIQWLAREGTKLDVNKRLRNKHFIVLISLTDPYGMLRESAEIMVGNERYEGFAIDIIHEMSQMLGFNYTFVVQADNVYGSYQKETGQWTGMIRKILDYEADLAITDLTITAERESAVDFTTPFMNLGISVLYRKPTKAPPGLLSFLLPYSNDIWVHLIGAYVLITTLLFFIGRICPVEWKNPYPCIHEPEVLYTPFTLKDTPFFIIGSILKGPTGFVATGISTRTIATTWWFFCLIMSSTYIANLAAALSTKSVVWPFKIAEELADQETIKYGAKRGGSTLAFFKNATYPPYEMMYQYMTEHASEVLTNKNEDGLRKVQQENYAFLMESTSIDYISHRHCNVTQIGGLLDAKGYGVAMRKDAPYRNDLSGAILKMKENGKINELQDKWWRQKRGGDKCEEKAEVKVAPLNFEDVGGVFLILISGVTLSWFYTGWCLIWHVRNVAVKQKVSFKQELVEELKFVAKCSSKKIVRRRNDSSEEMDRVSRTFVFE